MEKNYNPKADHTLKLYGDFDYLQEVFLNLLSNAEFALKKKNGPNPTIKINILSESEFKTYYSTKSSPSNFGLGLNYVETVVKQHHGNITVQSEVDQYTSFQIVLPRNKNREE